MAQAAPVRQGAISASFFCAFVSGSDTCGDASVIRPHDRELNQRVDLFSYGFELLLE